MEEIWKNWKENIYISNLGNVIGRKPSLDCKGYLHIKYKCKNYSIHRLVAKLFIPNTENKKEVDHINRNPLDNRVENLRWVTHIENNENKTDVRRIRGVRCIETGIEYRTISSIPDYQKYKTSYNHMREHINNGWAIMGYHYEYIK